jgi:hypothetical protein
MLSQGVRSLKYNPCLVSNPSRDAGRGRPARSNWRWAAVTAIVLLLAIRLPSLVQPAGGDQGLYGYAGQRILAGDVMYRDMWDQKPPGIALLYAALSRIWPGEALVPAADLAAAAAVAGLLVLLGRRRYTVNIGLGAASLFLLFGDPYLQRLSGIYIRGQCEPFMALAVTVSLVLLAHVDRRRWHLIAAGLALAVAVWLKYNAAAYGVPIAVATWAWGRDRRWRAAAADLAWVGLGFAALGLAMLVYFWTQGALHDLRLATVDYNLRYSHETYEGSIHPLRYLLTFPLVRARIDMIWFLGGLGALLVAARSRSDASTLVLLAWLLGAVLSIAINGSRSLPNYFVQANPALALAASAGLATLGARGRVVRAGVALLLIAALWRVGADAPWLGLRLASLPGLVENVRYDLDHLRGHTGRDEYLARFRGVKHDALENERLVRYIREVTGPADSVFVFGFSGGSVSWKSQRPSASRFYWSRPVIIEFAAGTPGYGSAGLLEDLRERPPAIVALQKDEWGSREFFLSNAPLRRWLEAGYVPDLDTEMFSVWRQDGH